MSARPAAPTADDSRRDRASTEDLAGALRAFMPELERFVRLEAETLHVRARSGLRRLTDRCRSGIGRDAVLGELSELSSATGSAPVTPASRAA